MPNYQQLMQATQNPNMRKMLDLIASSEGVKHEYNTGFGNSRFDSLQVHPNISKAFTQTDGTTNSTTAAGRYQFLKGTWDDIAKKYGLRDFSPQSQDFAATALIARRGALQDVLNGNYRAAVQKLGGEWASLPSSTYKQGKRSWGFVNRQLGLPMQEYQPEMVSLDKVGIGSKSSYKPEMINLENVGIGTKAPPSKYEPEFVDLKSIGIG